MIKHFTIKSADKDVTVNVSTAGDCLILGVNIQTLTFRERVKEAWAILTGSGDMEQWAELDLDQSLEVGSLLVNHHLDHVKKEYTGPDSKTEMRKYSDAINDMSVVVGNSLGTYRY